MMRDLKKFEKYWAGRSNSGDTRYNSGRDIFENCDAVYLRCPKKCIKDLKIKGEDLEKKIQILGLKGKIVRFTAVPGPYMEIYTRRELK